MTPRKPTIQKIVEDVKNRVARRIDVPFDKFWSTLTEKVEGHDKPRDKKQMKWLSGRKEAIREIFATKTSDRDNWQSLFRAIHEAYGCVFFSCCWWRLCVLFDMTKLVGASWFVPFESLPRQSFTYVHVRSDTKRGGGRRVNDALRELAAGL